MALNQYYTLLYKWCFETLLEIVFILHWLWQKSINRIAKNNLKKGKISTVLLNLSNNCKVSYKADLLLPWEIT